MRLSVLIPVYNEERTIGELIARVQEVPVDKEIIVIDDCSRDQTVARLHAMTGIRLVRHESNQGKGAAIRTGLAHATGDVVVIQDADLEYTPAEYTSLLRPFADPAVQAVYGSRFRRRGNRFLPLSRVANYFLTVLTDLLFGGRITDMETCYKVVRRPLLQRFGVVADRFEIEPEITAKLLRSGYRIVEVPISYRARTEGKKIGVKDGIMACYYLVKWYVS